MPCNQRDNDGEEGNFINWNPDIIIFRIPEDNRSNRSQSDRFTFFFRTFLLALYTRTSLLWLFRGNMQLQQ